MANIGAWFKARTGSLGGGQGQDTLFDGRWTAGDGKVMTVSGDKINGRNSVFATITSKNADGIMIKTTAGKPFAAAVGEDGSLVWTDGDVWRREARPTQDASDAMAGASAPPPDAEASDALATQALASGGPDLARAGWLAAEALALEEQAKEHDRGGSTAEALLGYRRASAKLVDAGECCPADHPDKLAMAEHGQDLTMRLLYLESLSGRPATEPVENQLPEEESLARRLSLDLSAQAPADQSIASLIASSGVTGTSAPLTDEGLSLVTALGSGNEMRTFVQRLLEEKGLVLHDGSESRGELHTFTERVAAGGGSGSLEQLHAELASFDWIHDPAAEAQAAADAAEAERLRLEAEARAAADAAEAERLRLEAEAVRAAEEARAAQERAEQEQAAATAAEAAAAARKELEKDKLNLAIVLEKEAKELEALGKKPEALIKFITCSHAFKYVYDYDHRAKNSEKVKEMVRQRLENVVAECTRLKLEGVVPPAPP